MKTSKFSEKQIAYARREVESGRPPADVWRQLGVSDATFDIWKKMHAHLGAPSYGSGGRWRTRTRG